MISKVHRSCLHWRNGTRRHFWTLRVFESFFVRRLGEQPVKPHPHKESCRFKATEQSHLSRCRLACGFTVTDMTYDSSPAYWWWGQRVYIRMHAEWWGTAHNWKNAENEVTGDKMFQYSQAYAHLLKEKKFQVVNMRDNISFPADRHLDGYFYSKQNPARLPGSSRAHVAPAALQCSEASSSQLEWRGNTAREECGLTPLGKYSAGAGDGKYLSHYDLPRSQICPNFWAAPSCGSSVPPWDSAVQIPPSPDSRYYCCLWKCSCKAES